MSSIYCLARTVCPHVNNAYSNRRTVPGVDVPACIRFDWLKAFKTMLIILLCLTFTKTYTQPVLNRTSSTIRPLNIGDRVPDIALNHLYNYSSTNTRLSAFRGKLLLLDFWATYCTACIQKMDRLEQLVKKYPDELEVLLVSTAGKIDTRQRIDAFYGRIKNSEGKRFRLPVVVNDTILSALFPNEYLPHVVWINAEQRVIAITGGEAVTAANIQAVLNGKVPAMEVKEDHPDFRPTKGLFKDGNGGSGNNFLFRSIITPHVTGIPSSSSMEQDKSGKVLRISHANAGLLFLIQQAYDSDHPMSHIDFSKAGNGIDNRDKDDQWKLDNSYCYDLVIPASSYAAAKQLMQQDLEQWFGITAITQPVQTDCFVLTADTGTLSRFRSAGGKQENQLFEPFGKLMRNSPVNVLASYLDAVLPMPVVNEINYPFNIDLNLPDGNTTDVTALKKALLPYGIKLEPARRAVPLFIITHQSFKQ